MFTKGALAFKSLDIEAREENGAWKESKKRVEVEPVQ